MRRGMVTFEYVYIIGLAAAALITMMIYISRGFQGNVRAAANQIGAGQYSPGNTAVSNINTKHLVSTVVSNSTSTTVYGNTQSGSPAMDANQAAQDALEIEITALENNTSLSDADRTTLIGEKTEELNTLADEYDTLSESWDNRAVTPNVTTSTSSNTDTSTQTINNQTNEGLGNFANDTWN